MVGPTLPLVFLTIFTVLPGSLSFLFPSSGAYVVYRNLSSAWGAVLSRVDTPAPALPVKRPSLDATRPALSRPVSPRLSPLWTSSVADPGVSEEEVSERVISISEAAIAHLMDLKAKEGKDHLYLRMGVRSGGCSGLSYVMDLVGRDTITEEDHTEEYPEQGFTCVVDPKSMLYLFGLVLDYKDALIGGGFQFFNPSAQETCGCGKSFGV